MSPGVTPWKGLPPGPVARDKELAEELGALEGLLTEQNGHIEALKELDKIS